MHSSSMPQAETIKAFRVQFSHLGDLADVRSQHCGPGSCFFGRAHFEPPLLFSPHVQLFLPRVNTPRPTQNSQWRYFQNGTSNFRPRDQGSISTQITGGQILGPRRSGIAVTDDLSRTTHTSVGGAWVRVSNEDEMKQVPLKVHEGGHRHQSSGWTEGSEGNDYM